MSADDVTEVPLCYVCRGPIYGDRIRNAKRAERLYHPTCYWKTRAEFLEQAMADETKRASEAEEALDRLRLALDDLRKHVGKLGNKRKGKS